MQSNKQAKTLQTTTRPTAGQIKHKYVYIYLYYTRLNIQLHYHFPFVFAGVRMVQPLNFFVILAFLALTSSATASHEFNVEKLSNVIETSHRCRKNTNPGLAVAVVREGRTLLSRGYGVTSLYGNMRVTSSTRFNVASLTKAITAALLVKVMEESGR